MSEPVCLAPGCPWPTSLCSLRVSFKCLFYETDPDLTLGLMCNTDVLCQTQNTFMCAWLGEQKCNWEIQSKKEVKRKPNLFRLSSSCCLFFISFGLRGFFKLFPRYCWCYCFFCVSASSLLFVFFSICLQKACM